MIYSHMLQLHQHYHCQIPELKLNLIFVTAIAPIEAGNSITLIAPTQHQLQS